MLAITASAVLLAARLPARLLATLAWTGAYLTPVLLSTGEDRAVSLFLFLLVLDAGALVLEQRTGGAVESMEGAAIAHVARLHGIPVGEVRGISNLVANRDPSAFPEKSVASWSTHDTAPINAWWPELQAYEREGLSNSLAEAMACGLACIAPEYPIGGEVLGDAGVVPPDNDPQSLLDGLVALADDSSRRVSLGAVAAERARRSWSTDAVVDAYERIYSHMPRGTT